MSKDRKDCESRKDCKKRKTKLPETIDEVEEDLKAAEAEVTGAVSPEGSDPVKGDPVKGDTLDKIREELIRLSEDGEISQSVAYLKKASKRTISKVYAEIERKRAAKANEFLTDLIISKWSDDLLGGSNAIESSESLTDELKKGSVTP